MGKVFFLVLILVNVNMCRMPCEDINDRGVTYLADHFHANMLYGKWQCSYNTMVGDYEIKEIEFYADGRTADIILCKRGVTNRVIKTFEYHYNGKQLWFDIHDPALTLSFYWAIKRWIYPELTLYDAYGEYSLKKNC